MVKRRLQEPMSEDIASVKLEEFLGVCKSKGLAERTIEQYEDSVKLFISICGDKNVVGEDDVLHFTGSLDNSPGRANYYLRGLRTFSPALFNNIGKALPRCQM